jgi:hypothetical protein
MSSPNLIEIELAAFNLALTASGLIQAKRKLADLPKKDGKVEYLGKWWTPDEPVKSNKSGKKMMVLAVDDGEVALIHFGDDSMDDFTTHEDKDRRDNFYKRFANTKSSRGKRALEDKFSPLYWSAKILWPKK